jgi:hypothetical protein
VAAVVGVVVVVAVVAGVVACIDYNLQIELVYYAPFECVDSDSFAERNHSHNNCI